MSSTWPPEMSAADPDRVTATPAALELVAELTAEYGPVIFHQSGGCCDGSSPMCYPAGDLVLGDGDLRLGTIGGAGVYISRSQGAAWAHTRLIIDVVQDAAVCSRSTTAAKGGS